MNAYPTESSIADEQACQKAAIGLLEFSREERRFPTTHNFVDEEDDEMRDIDDEALDSEAASILMTMKHSDHAADRLLSLDSQYGNVFPPSSAHKHDAGLSSDDDLAFHSEDTRSVNNDQVIPTPRRRAQKKDTLDSDSEDEYVPSQYHRNRLDTSTNWVRRSTRKTQQLQSLPFVEPLPAPLPTFSSVLPSHPRRRTPNVDSGEGFMPSAENDFKFKYDSPTGRTAAELDALFQLPAHPKQLPTDLRGLKANGMKLSYRQLGAMPKKGLADELVAQMEKEHKRIVREYGKEEIAKNGPM